MSRTIRSDGNITLRSEIGSIELNPVGGTVTVSTDMSITGNLTITGSTVTSSATSISDRIVTLNAGEIGAGVSLRYSGVEIDRGSLDNALLVFDENDDLLYFSTDNGSTYSLILLEGEALQNVVEDTTPQLGGNLDVNGNSIVSASNGNITIQPDGTGQIVMNKVDINSGAIDQTPIGASTPSTGAFTTLSASTSLNVTGVSTLNGDLVFSNANPEIRGGDTDGVMHITPSTANNLGGNITLYGDTATGVVNDIRFRASATNVLYYDHSATTWDFQDRTITTTGPITGAAISGTTGSFSSTISAATGSTIGNLTLANGSITDSSGAISFGNENLSTTGTLSAAVATLATGSTIGNLTLANGSITDSSGAISFGDENLSTTGTLGAGATTLSGDLTFSVSTPVILGNDDDGSTFIGAGSATSTGANISLYGASEATDANDIRFRSGTTVVLRYDHSSTTWNFQDRTITTTDNVNAAAVVVTDFTTTNIPPKYTVEAESAVFTVTAAERGKLFNCTSTFTATLPSELDADMYNGWLVVFKNSGTGTITIDTAGSATIDGETSVTLNPGEANQVIFDGTNYLII